MTTKPEIDPRVLTYREQQIDKGSIFNMRLEINLIAKQWNLKVNRGNDFQTIKRIIVNSAKKN